MSLKLYGISINVVVIVNFNHGEWTPHSWWAPLDFWLDKWWTDESCPPSSPWAGLSSSWQGNPLLAHNQNPYEMSCALRSLLAPSVDYFFISAASRQATPRGWWVVRGTFSLATRKKCHSPFLFIGIISGVFLSLIFPQRRGMNHWIYKSFA